MPKGKNTNVSTKPPRVRLLNGLTGNFRFWPARRGQMRPDHQHGKTIARGAHPGLGAPVPIFLDLAEGLA